MKALGLETLKEHNKYLPLFNKKLSTNQEFSIPLESPKSHIVLPPLEPKEKSLSPLNSPKESTSPIKMQNEEEEEKTK